MTFDPEKEQSEDGIPVFLPHTHSTTACVWLPLQALLGAGNKNLIFTSPYSSGAPSTALLFVSTSMARSSFHTPFMCWTESQYPWMPNSLVVEQNASSNTRQRACFVVGRLSVGLSFVWISGNENRHSIELNLKSSTLGFDMALIQHHLVNGKWWGVFLTLWKRNFPNNVITWTDHLNLLILLLWNVGLQTPVSANGWNLSRNVLIPCSYVYPVHICIRSSLGKPFRPLYPNAFLATTTFCTYTYTGKLSGFPDPHFVITWCCVLFSMYPVFTVLPYVSVSAHVPHVLVSTPHLSHVILHICILSLPVIVSFPPFLVCLPVSHYCWSVIGLCIYSLWFSWFSVKSSLTVSWLYLVLWFLCWTLYLIFFLFVFLFPAPVLDSVWSVLCAYLVLV